MKIQLKEDILGSEFRAGWWVEVIEASNLPDNPDGRQYWLMEGADADGTHWNNHPVGYLITPDEVERIMEDV